MSNAGNRTRAILIMMAVLIGTMTWGSNRYGQVGDGTTVDRSAPVQVTGLPDIVAVSAGSSHNLAIHSDGSASAWGSKDDGQLGDDTTTTRLTPVPVRDLTDVVAVSGATSFSLALTGDGIAWARGDNQSGMLGDGTFVNERHRPVQVVGLTDVVSLATGDRHSLALLGDGSVWAWGYNRLGRLGDGTEVTRRTPVVVTALSDASVVDASGEHSMSITSNGRVWGWGKNLNGQVGHGGEPSYWTPVRVDEPR